MDIRILTEAANQARGLAMDAVSAAKSGHLGLPLGSADIGAVLFAHGLSFNPDAPDWINRDRFVLSAGHGSMFLYSWLHLSGYDLPLEEIKRFRQLHSRTPGHPEFRETPGVECTTGPLGQGVGNAVGMAVAAKMAASLLNTPSHKILDHCIVCLCGDGCLQEGVSAEAASFAGHHGLDNLIIIYDSNDVTLDAMASKTQSEKVTKRFEAYGFDTITIDGHDMRLFARTFESMKQKRNGRPQFIEIKTKIGKGIAEVEGTHKAHGEAGVPFVEKARQGLGLPAEKFFVSQEVRSFFEGRKKQRIAEYAVWEKLFADWKSKNPNLEKLLSEGLVHDVPGDLLHKIPYFPAGKKSATRASGGEILQTIAKAMPWVISGSADLHGSTKNYIKEGGDFSKDHPTGRNIYWGIREHGMGAIMNGIAYYGLFRVSGATFLTFSDYMRPSVRLAALSKLPVFYIWTHDSVGVGEDGPTHEPVETVSSLRLIPNLDVIRPADAEETAGAFVGALEKKDGPTALILSRQDLPDLSFIPTEERRRGAMQGGYIALREKGSLDKILIATGSELQHAIEAAKQLGDGIRVVSMPCWERFERQSESYKKSVLPDSCRKRISIEAGVTKAWHYYVGIDGKAIGIDRFGLSAPGEIIMRELGMTPEHIVEEVKSL